MRGELQSRLADTKTGGRANRTQQFCLLKSALGYATISNQASAKLLPQKINFSAGALFDFDKAVLKPESRGETRPLTQPADCKRKKGKALIACLQPDRRVD